MASRVDDFELVWRGYDQRQVQKYIDDLNLRLTAALSGLDAANSLETELYQAQAEIERLRGIIRRISASTRMEDRLTKILGLAEDHASNMRNEAERDAREIRDRALAEAIRARRDFEASLRARRDEQWRLDERMRAAAEAEAQRLLAEAQSAHSAAMAAARSGDGDGQGYYPSVDYGPAVGRAPVPPVAEPAEPG
jgi:cell division septum initiation protein DivIVA